MSGLKQLRQRIVSVRSTQKMTQAMNLIATTRLRGARAAIEATRPYAKRLDGMLTQIHARYPTAAEGTPLFVGRGREQVYLLVVFTTNRGLCGGLNTGIVKVVKERIARLEEHGREARLLCVGRKGRRLLEREHGSKIIGTIEQSHYKDVGFEMAVPIAKRILSAFEAHEFDVCCQYYPRFHSILHQVPKAQQLIPARFSVTTSASDTASYRAHGKPMHEYEPDVPGVLDRLLPHYVTAQVYRAMMECSASEEGARIAATDRASRNAGELIQKLSLSYNRQRQAAITREIIEIIAGVETLTTR